MKQKPYHMIRMEIDLPLLTACWVLTAHVLTILAPLVMIFMVVKYHDYLASVMYSPLLLLCVAGLFIAASIFESAQNTLDRWYLIGTPPALCDLFFNSLLVIALGLSVLAYRGDIFWLWWLMIPSMLIFPFIYLMGWLTTPFLAITGLASTLAAYFVLQNPIVFFSLLATFLTVFFLSILLKTHNQIMHGFTTIVNALGLLATPLAIYQSANNQPSSWQMVAISFLVVGILCVVSRKFLLRLSATPRLMTNELL